MKDLLGEFSWVGSQEHFVDQVHVHPINGISVGRFGGNSSAGQYKNEDGCLVWLNPNGATEFAVILDAHNTGESAELIIEHFNNKKTEIADALSLPVNQAFKRLEDLVLNLFQGEEFLNACEKVKGEAACLIVARKDKYLWWLSVGDNILCLFHSELAARGQYQVNQRHFYEWIGKANTFNQLIPCFSIGTKELRKGVNRLFLTTDGLIECPNEPFTDPNDIFKVFSTSQNDEESIMTMLKTIQEYNVRDSTTIITWEVNISEEATQPSHM